jgi:hypothetical protein
VAVPKANDCGKVMVTGSGVLAAAADEEEAVEAEAVVVVED